MTVGDLIKNKDYDYISWRIKLPEYLGGVESFFGIAKSENGKLISLDDEYYSKDTNIISYSEWSNDTKGIKNGLTIICESDFI